MINSFFVSGVNLILSQPWDKSSVVFNAISFKASEIARSRVYLLSDLVYCSPFDEVTYWFSPLNSPNWKVLLLEYGIVRF